MKMKMSMLGFVSGLMITACGGPELEDAQAPAEELGTTQGALCEGWDSGARKCSFQCYSYSTWWTTSATVSYGQCQEYANGQCGRTAYGTCWSK